MKVYAARFTKGSQEHQPFTKAQMDMSKERRKEQRKRKVKASD